VLLAKYNQNDKVKANDMSMAYRYMVRGALHISWGVKDWNYLAKNKDRYRALVSTVMKSWSYKILG
jgi:hypothetical protein